MAYLDECGFSPSQPVSYSWTLPGVRKTVPYENPQGRRVNALAVLLPVGPTPALWWDSAPRTLTAHDVLATIAAIPRGPGALVVVLDNASIHTSRVIKDALPRLRRRGIHLYYLPPYSPELNRIESIFGVAKHTEMPERTDGTVAALADAIDRAFTACEQRLLDAAPPLSLETLHHARPAA